MPVCALRTRDRSNAGAADAAALRKEVFGFREIFGTRPSMHLTDEQRAQRFWMGMLYAALAGYCATGLIALGYALLTWDQPHRYLITATALFGITIAPVFYTVRYRIVAMSYRVLFFEFWCCCAWGCLTLVSVLDGGVNSALTFLFFLPMLYLANGFPLRAVLFCGGVALLCYGLVAAGTNAPIPVMTAVLQAATLTLGWVLALIGAVNRQRQEGEAGQLRQRLEELAITDDLTGCLNHRAFVEALDREIERAARDGQSVALLTIDIDHFKQINDNHGHLMGDEVLRQIGLKLRQTARKSDVAGRPGGDELALLAPKAESVEARALAERLQHDIQALKLPMQLTLSIGICVSSPDVEPAATLLRRADQALYEAKRRGRNQTAVFGEPSAVNCRAALAADAGS